jgi:hypothetical protein
MAREVYRDEGSNQATVDPHVECRSTSGPMTHEEA